MRDQINQDMLNDEAIHLVKDEINIRSFQNNFMKENLKKYLKSWGNDYPYLNDYENCMNKCLPIPENSEAQRVIRRLTGYPQVK
jgi:hypothetical protein